MNTLLAEYKVPLSQWKQSEKISIEPKTPMIDGRHWRLTHEGTRDVTLFPDLFEIKALNACRWDDPDNNFHALPPVANLWQKGDAYFSLRLPGWNRNGNFLIRQIQPERYYHASSAALRNSLELPAPALSWTFLLLEPYSAKITTGTEMNSSSIAAGKVKALSHILKA